jgi:hypothetical protein
MNMSSRVTGVAAIGLWHSGFMRYCFPGILFIW